MAVVYTVNEKGDLQHVASVVCNHGLCAEGSSSAVKLVCANFTRNPAILALAGRRDGEERDDGSAQSWGSTASNSNAVQTQTKPKAKKITLFCDDAAQRTRLTGFADYLRERKKAALCRYTEGHDWALLPPAHGKAEMIQAFLVPHVSASASAPSSTAQQLLQPNKAAAGSAGAFSSSSASASAAAGSAKAPAAAATAPKKTSLIASLAKRTSSSTGVAARLASQQAAKQAKAQASNYIDKLETDVKIKLEAFEDDPSLKEVRMEPMDKDYRYVVHDVVSQYPELVSSSVGDMEDRHCVIYRRGFQPDDVEIYVSKAEMRSSAPLARGSKTSIVGPGAKSANKVMNGTSELTTLNTEKKDRRTIEELKRDGEFSLKREREDDDGGGADSAPKKGRQGSCVGYLNIQRSRHVPLVRTLSSNCSKHLREPRKSEPELHGVFQRQLRRSKALPWEARNDDRTRTPRSIFHVGTSTRSACCCTIQRDRRVYHHQCHLISTGSTAPTGGATATCL